MKIKTLGYALMLLVGCATLNGTVAAKGKGCVQVMISGDSALEGKLVMWATNCRGGTPGWVPLLVNTPNLFQSAPSFKIVDKKTMKTLYTIDEVEGTIQILCMDTPKGPQCIPPSS